jgi:hypothetical protein
VDSQSLKSTGVGGNERGFDHTKQVEGTKRHLLVDTEGMVLKAKVLHSPRVPDEDGIRLLCWTRRVIVSLAWLTCGWTPASRGEAGDGPRRLWG